MKIRVIGKKKLIDREFGLRRTLLVANDFPLNQNLMDQISGQLEAIEYVLNGYTQSQFELEVNRWIKQGRPSFTIETGKSADYVQGVDLIKSLLYKEVTE